MRRAVFLDRDGTILREVDNLRDVRQLRLLPGAASAICTMRALGFAVVVITNQPVVARGWITEAELAHIHAVLVARLAARGAQVDGIYYCPHHPNANLAAFRAHCSCRKPEIALYQCAARDLRLSMAGSYGIGDRTADIEAGRRAGLTTILVATGYGGRDGVYPTCPDLRANNLPHVAALLQRHGA